MEEGPLDPTTVRLKTSTGTADSTRAVLRGDFVTLLPAEVFSASAPITVTVSDGKPTPTVRSYTFPLTECRTSPNGLRIICRRADKRAKATFRSALVAQGVSKLTRKLAKRSIT